MMCWRNWIFKKTVLKKMGARYNYLGLIIAQELLLTHVSTSELRSFWYQLLFWLFLIMVMLCTCVCQPAGYSLARSARRYITSGGHLAHHCEHSNTANTRTYDLWPSINSWLSLSDDFLTTMDTPSDKTLKASQFNILHISRLTTSNIN